MYLKVLHTSSKHARQPDHTCVKLPNEINKLELGKTNIKDPHKIFWRKYAPITTYDQCKN